MALILIMGLIGIYPILKSYFNPEIIYVPACHALDVSDDNVLAGFADNIFIGRVQDKKGNKKSYSFPQTQFEVQVIKNIKGSLEGNVTVNQDAGFDGFKFYIFEKDKLLDGGQYYLFVTKYCDKEEWHNLVPYYGDILIDDEEMEKNLIERFTKAYENEIEWDK